MTARRHAGFENTGALTRQHFLLIQEMCIDGEQRCEQRAADARARRDHQSAHSELQLKERSTSLKMKMMKELTRPSNAVPDARDDEHSPAPFDGSAQKNSSEQEPRAAL